MSKSIPKTCSVEECAGRYHARGFCNKHYRQRLSSDELKLIARKNRSPIERFLERIVIADSGCWEWQGSRDRQGYGHISTASKKMRVHRFSYQHYRKPIPDGLCVLHHCDNPPCCNPLHLYVGTPADNVRDKVSRGRHSFGEDCNTAKLTEGQVREIRRAHANGQTMRGLGRAYGVAESTVRDVVHQQSWKHVR